MRKTLYTSILSGLLLILNGCDNYDKLIPAQYQKVMYLNENGIKELTLYRTGQDTEYTLSVIKTGNNPAAIAQGQIELMQDDKLQIISEQKGIHYKKLPANCFTLQNQNVTLTQENPYSKVRIVMKTDEIKTLLDATTDDTQYILPLVLVSARDSINHAKSNLILQPKVVTPKVSFSQTGKVGYYCNNKPQVVKIPITMPISNQWDFTCTVEADPSGAGTGETLISGYTLENEGTVNFEKGKDTAWLSVKLPGLKKISDKFVLPLKLKSIEGIGFELDPQLYTLDLSSALVLSVDMLSTNAAEPNEGSLAGLLDKDPRSFFHSAWSVQIGAPHYIQVALPAELEEFEFTYDNRFENGNAAIQDLDVSTSTDGTTFTLLRNFTSANDGLPTQGVQSGSNYSYTSPMLSASSPVKYIRFTCNRSPGGPFFVWSRFSLSGW